jgi:pectin methylesterase-like acyl-CoA thioesterase
MKRVLGFLIVFGMLLSSLPSSGLAADGSQMVSKKYGDLNGDDNFNAIDFALMRSYLIGIVLDFPVSNWNVVGDVNADNAVNSIDFAYMRSYLLGIVNEFPAEKSNPLPTAEVPSEVIYQAELATLYNADFENIHAGYTDSGYVNYRNESGSYVEWNVNAVKYGAYKLTFRFANGTSSNRMMTISINGKVVWNNLDFNSTGDWASWSENSIVVNLNQGTNLIRATAITSDGGPNVDCLKVAFTTEVVTTPTEQPIQTPTVVPTPTTSTDTSDGTVVTDFSQLKAAIANGGKIYVKGTTISCSEQIALSKTDANVEIIGLKNSDGTYPVLDFSSFRSNYIGKATSDSQVGIRITGSKYTIRNLIIEKAPDNGIQIKGSSAGNNKISNCIVRYNNDSGLQITSGAYNNTIEYVCSYRNCDVYTLGGNADGFAPKLAAGRGNTFYACYAWDNSDDGWDSYDKTDGLTYDLTYTECACWNNGNPNVFTGKYDFDNGKPLDTNLLLVELICRNNPSFATNYANRYFSLPTNNFIATSEGTLSVSAWTGSSYGGNPNGFKMGSAYSTSACTRTFKNCLAFSHSKKGFDNNNSAVTGYFTNCVGFDNGYNYYISPLTIKAFSNAISFSGNSGDNLPNGVRTTTPDYSTQSAIRSAVRSTSEAIMNACKNNIIPGAVYFDIYGGTIGSGSSGNSGSSSTIPSGAIVVDKNGSGNYTSVQGAVNSLGSNSSSPKTIYIKNGEYKEVVTIPSGVSNLTIIGESKDAVIHYDNYNGKSNGNGGTYGTGGSASVFIKGSDITVQNITFKNSFIEKGNSNEQAVALNATGNRIKFYNCNFLGNQDTLLCDGGTQYFYKCLIAGDVDFIFGRSQAVFESCEIRSLNRGSSNNNGYITAARTEATASYGFLFLNCNLTCESGTASNSVWLGRPWCPSGTDVNKPAVAYINCTMGAHIKTEGWTSMSGVPASHGRFYEYNSSGSGAIISSTRPQLNASQAASFTKSNVLGGWNPSF